MRIVSSYTPGEFTANVKKLTINSRGVLLTAIYCAGLVSGNALYIAVPSFGQLAERAIADTIVNRMPCPELIVLLTVVSLGAGTVLFGSGLSLVGYPCIYLTPFVTGLCSALIIMPCFVTGAAVDLIKCVLLLPVYSCSVCAVLNMCEYSCVMSGWLLQANGSREADEVKKYAVRIIILTLTAIVINCLLGLLVVLFRHFS